jgi:hypothetical protein
MMAQLVAKTLELFQPHLAQVGAARAIDGDRLAQRDNFHDVASRSVGQSNPTAWTAPDL